MASSSPVHTVRLPAMAAYFALRLAGRLHLPGTVASALRASLMEGTLGPNGRKLMEMASGGMPDAIVPFERDLLDIRVAAAHADRSRDSVKARLRSAWARRGGGLLAAAAVDDARRPAAREGARRGR